MSQTFSRGRRTLSESVLNEMFQAVINNTTAPEEAQEYQVSDLQNQLTGLQERVASFATEYEGVSEERSGHIQITLENGSTMDLGGLNTVTSQSEHARGSTAPIGGITQRTVQNALTDTDPAPDNELPRFIFNESGITANNISGGLHFDRGGSRSWNSKAKNPNMDHYDDVIVQYQIPEQYADHVIGASRIFDTLEVSHYTMSRMVVPGQIYIQFTFLKEKITAESHNKVMADVRKWNCFLSYLYAVQKDYDLLLWEKNVSLADRKLKLNDSLSGVKKEPVFKQLEKLYSRNDFNLVLDKKMATTGMSFSGHYQTLEMSDGYTFLNIYELLEDKWDRAEFATLYGYFSTMRQGRVSTGTRFVTEVGSGKGTDIDTQVFVMIVERHGRLLENMYIQHITPGSAKYFTITSSDEEMWEEKVKQIRQTNSREECRYIVKAPRVFHGFKHV